MSLKREAFARANRWGEGGVHRGNIGSFGYSTKHCKSQSEHIASVPGRRHHLYDASAIVGIGSIDARRVGSGDNIVSYGMVIERAG